MMIKKIVSTALLSLFGLTLVQSQNVCSKYYPMEEGTSFQLTTYDNKDKVTAIINYLVSETALIGSSQRATMATEIMDEEGTPMATSAYDILCEDDAVSIDFKSLMGPDMYSKFPEMDMEVSGTALHLPNNLEEGQMLPDADMLAVVNISPIKMRMTFLMKNRKVEGKETVTTPAGSFDCIILSYEYESKFGIKVSGMGKQWLAEGVGLVQQEDYNKKGKVMSKTILTRFGS